MINTKKSINNQIQPFTKCEATYMGQLVASFMRFSVIMLTPRHRRELMKPLYTQAGGWMEQLCHDSKQTMKSN